MIDGLIYNSNGNFYEIIAYAGDYLLLYNSSNEFTPYTVAYDYNKNRMSWASGTYFREFEMAIEHFISVAEVGDK